MSILAFAHQTSERVLSQSSRTLLRVVPETPEAVYETRRFFVRLDADSHVTRPVTKRTDALIAAAEGGQLYVFWSVAVESCRLHSALLICMDLK